MRRSGRARHLTDMELPMRRYLLLLALGCAGPALAQAQTPPAEPAAAPLDAAPAPPDAEEAEEIVVAGQRQRGSVIGDIEPEIQLTPADIRSYGVNSVTELLAELAPQTGSVRGRGGERPVVLLNGRRISGFTEIRDLPTEAIARVDILPEEVALKYGFRPNQRVVNFVLRNRFRATTVELGGGLATDGGGERGEGSVDVLTINRDRRFELNLQYRRQEPLLESQRAIDRSDLGGTVDQGPFRTLVPTQDTFAVNTVASRTIADGVGLTINPRVERVDSVALLGLGASGVDPRTQARETLTGHFGTTLNGAISGWQWTFTGNWDRVETRIATEAVAGARERASSVSEILAADMTVNGSPLKLPAGDVSTTVVLGASTLDFGSRSFRNGRFTPGAAARDIGEGRLSLDLPVASRRRGVLSAIGDLSLNGNVEVRRLSDFGTLTSFGGGVTWSPIPVVDVVASYNDERDAPTPQQLADPLIATPLVRVFDFVTGRPVLVTQITGGNAALAEDRRQVTKLGITVRPSIGERIDLSLVANYVDQRTRNPVFSLANPTAAIQDAFPDRFVRDATGALVSVDSRPVNFARESSRQLRWGFNLSLPLKADPARIEALRAAGAFARPGGERRGPGEGEGARRGGDGGGGGFRGGGGGFGGGGRGGQLGGRVQLALFHTWVFENELLVRPGGPRLDLLDGDAVGARGGASRHRLEAQAGITQNGLGARLSANWQSATNVRGGSGDPADTLRFASLATVNFRLFANLGVQPALVRDRPWLRGTRVTLSVDNLFNARQRVTDATGLVPLSFQPALLDPLGRVVRVQFRKLFF
jgi:uncharacterized membrane protein YgcG